MSFFTYHHQFFSSLWDWSGRMRRRDYWMGRLCVGITTGLSFIAVAVLAKSAFWPVALLAAILWFLYFLLGLLADAASVVRRLHDVGESGHLYWLRFIGGELVLLTFLVGDSQGFPNAYGEDPKRGEHVGPLPPAAPTPRVNSSPEEGR